MISSAPETGGKKCPFGSFNGFDIYGMTAFFFCGETKK